MANKRSKVDSVISAPAQDGIDRRGFLQCMAWAGAGLVWTFRGGIASSQLFAATGHGASQPDDFTFVQISDSHIGFDKAANTDVTATFQAAIEKINAQPVIPDFIIHTGDISHLSKPSEFDTATQVLKGVKSKQAFYVPGEHDVAIDRGEQFLRGWRSGFKPYTGGTGSRGGCQSWPR